MTILPIQEARALDLLEVCRLSAQHVDLTRQLIGRMTIEEVLGLVGSAYRSVPEGNVTAGRCRDLADELEMFGTLLGEKYAV